MTAKLRAPNVTLRVKALAGAGGAGTGTVFRTHVRRDLLTRAARWRARLWKRAPRPAIARWTPCGGRWRMRRDLLITPAKASGNRAKEARPSS